VLHTDKAKQTYALAKAKAIRGMSIGYDTVRSVMKDGVRQLTELKLYEVSLTAWPANELALVTSVKHSDDLVGEFRRVMLLCARQIRGE
jgi:HK97 family phage prohead protease